MPKEEFAYRKSLQEIAEGLADLMADLEDVRDDAQDCLEETAHPAVRRDVAQIDAALAKLNETADLLEEAAPRA